MHLTFKQYRALDIIIFTLALCVFESFLTFIWNLWFVGDPFIPSALFLILALVYMRWGWQAIIPAVTCGIVVTSVGMLTDKSITGVQYFYAIVGNLFSAFILIFIKLVKKDKIRATWTMSAVYATLIYFFIELGRAIVHLFVVKNIGEAFSYFATHLLLRDLIAYALLLIGVLVARRFDGLFEDQKSYLFRLEKEKK